MNLKKKLTSTLSLVLAFSILLSTAALATEGSSSAEPDGSTAYTEPQEPADPPATTPEGTESTTPPQDDPADPETDPTDGPDTPDPSDTPDQPADPQDDPAATEDDPAPEEMTAGGWSETDGRWEYTYVNLKNESVKAGADVLKGKYQFFYLPEAKLLVNGEVETLNAGFYAFSEGQWVKNYTAPLGTVKDIVEIELQGLTAYQVADKDRQYAGNRLITFAVNKDGQSVGELYNGKRKEKCAAEKNKSLYRRYRDGQPYNGFGLGTDSKLYYYSSGFYQTAVSLTKLKASSGYHLFEEKLYYATATTLKSYNAPVFTGRWTNPQDGVRRRYEKGVPFTGFGLGTQKVPFLYYYVDGLYQKTLNKSGTVVYNGVESRTNLENFLDSSGKVWEGNGKRYISTDKTLDLNGTNTQPYAEPVNGYYTIDGKLYSYTNGTGGLFTGRWKNPADGITRRYEKGEPYNGFGLGTQSPPCLYYYVNGQYQTEESREKIHEEFGGNGKKWTDGKLYVATDKTLTGTGTQPYAVPLTGYRMEDGLMYKYTKGTGVLFTGIYNGTEPELSQYKGAYFAKGEKKPMPNGWTTVSGKRYYVKNGKFVTGWQYITTNGVKYKYYFDSTGAQISDLFSHFGSSYKKKAMTVRVNRNNHTADILLYNSETKKYDIAAKSFVCSTCLNAAQFKPGTYKIKWTTKQKNGSRWWSFHYPKDYPTSDAGKTFYFQYGIRISDAGSLIHSSSYASKNIYTLKRGNYNKLGTNQSFYCIRLQVANCKLIYDAYNGGNKKIKVQLVKSSHNGPYGKITLANTTGKLSSKYNYDPTDPLVKK